MPIRGTTAPVLPSVTVGSPLASNAAAGPPPPGPVRPSAGTAAAAARVLRKSRRPMRSLLMACLFWISGYSGRLIVILNAAGHNRPDQYEEGAMKSVGPIIKTAWGAAL